MKRLAVVLFVVLLLSLLSACTGSQGESIAGRMGESLTVSKGESLRYTRTIKSNASMSVGGDVDVSDVLSGKYRSVDDEDATITFSGNTLTMADEYYGFEFTGTYSISGDKLTITITVAGLTETETVDFSMSGKSLFIDGDEYIKD